MAVQYDLFKFRNLLAEKQNKYLDIASALQLPNGKIHHDQLTTYVTASTLALAYTEIIKALDQSEI